MVKVNKLSESQCECSPSECNFPVVKSGECRMRAREREGSLFVDALHWSHRSTSLLHNRSNELLFNNYSAINIEYSQSGSTVDPQWIRGAIKRDIETYILNIFNFALLPAPDCPALSIEPPLFYFAHSLYFRSLLLCAAFVLPSSTRFAGLARPALSLADSLRSAATLLLSRTHWRTPRISARCHCCGEALLTSLSSASDPAACK